MSNFAGRMTRDIAQDHGNGEWCTPNFQGYCPCPLELAPEETAELVCSDTGRTHHSRPESGWDTVSHPITEPQHLPVFDLDFGAQLVPSGTDGHFHLYLDRPVPWSKYLKVLEAMTDAGLCQPGYLSATRERGFGSLRHPDRPKKVAA